MQMTHTIETDRLTLRSLREEDIKPLFQVQSDPDAMRYTFCATSREEAEQRLWTYAELEEQVGFAPWVVILRSELQIIGWGGLNIDPFDPGWGVEIAYFFDPAYWGQGFGTELVESAVKHGFRQHALMEINAYAHQENRGSVRVLEKCGFEFECFEPKLNRNHYVINREKWLKARHTAYIKQAISITS